MNCSYGALYVILSAFVLTIFIIIKLLVNQYIAFNVIFILTGSKIISEKMNSFNGLFKTILSKGKIS